MLVREVSHEAVTLRAVARELGVSAPSIYLHFADRDELVRAALAAQFDRLTAAVATAVAGAPTVREAMRAGLLAYCRFAAEEPGGYAVMFARPLPSLGSGPVGTASFDALVAGSAVCIADGTFAAGDPTAIARQLWAALHGMVSLRAVMPQFGWNSIEDAVDELLTDFGRRDPQQPGD